AYLEPVARLAHWRVYRVAGAPRLVTGPARLVELGPDRFSVRFARAGTSLVRLRFTDYWAPRGGCVRPAPGGFTAVSKDRPGAVTVVARLGLRGLLHSDGRCRPG
ncbi:MAG: hypothetical protein QOG42_999, partial [Solirubrobacteraceae bacterium]|nr:hypothetical protein [Solirubrobacteraceae bacterium]